MTKIRILVMLLTVVVVGVFGSVAIFYARGFRLERESQNITISPKGLLVVNSEPTGAQIFIDDKLTSATNSTLTVTPGEHTIVVKKEGYLDWKKVSNIGSDAVTVVNAFMLPSAPSLTAFTTSGAISPSVNEDQTKIIYIVPTKESADTKSGMWLAETTNLPLGFSRDPRQVSDMTPTDSQIEWSPDSREILLTTQKVTYRLNLNQFTTAKQATIVTATKDAIRAEWKTKRTDKLTAKLSALPDQIRDVFLQKVKTVTFSPDENRILYVASGSATIPEGLVNALPGSSTQKETRKLTDGISYVYDIKEDKNFEVGAKNEIIYWIPNSLNLLIPQKDAISVVDYDGTNRNVIYSGNYIFPYAYPSTSTNRVLILTNFGAEKSTPNLYWLGIK
ncbi:PEGA domain-containing protein [Candidatus Woesebacteria bacterium]|nr:PEGA domain-containing protein [Candidatus Woesebacteria bacterium]